MTTEMKAHLRYLRIAPRKVRLLADTLKGISVEDALLQLRHIRNRAPIPLGKLIQSAVANAKHNFQIDEGLRVKNIRVDQGPVLKRFMPRARGSASPIRKRTSHISLTLEASRTPKS